MKWFWLNMILTWFTCKNQKVVACCWKVQKNTGYFYVFVLLCFFLFPRPNHDSRWLLHLQQSCDIPANIKEVREKEINISFKEIRKSEGMYILGKMMIGFIKGLLSSRHWHNIRVTYSWSFKTQYYFGKADFRVINI